MLVLTNTYAFKSKWFFMSWVLCMCVLTLTLPYSIQMCHNFEIKLQQVLAQFQPSHYCRQFWIFTKKNCVVLLFCRYLGMYSCLRNVLELCFYYVCTYFNTTVIFNPIYVVQLCKLLSQFSIYSGRRVECFPQKCIGPGGEIFSERNLLPGK